MHIRDLILQLTYLSSPRIFGQSLGGAWTDDNQYYSREASDLVLKYVYWVDVTGTFEVSSALELQVKIVSRKFTIQQD